MSTSYKVLARDGAEFGPATAETLHEWFREGRIHNGSLVCVNRTSNWRRLDETFDLATWAPASSDQPASGPAMPDYTPRTLTRIAWDDDVRTSGMLAAAILLFINAAVSIVQLVLLTFELGHYAETVTGTFFLAAGPTMDIIVGVGLLRGRWQWRTVAIIRSALGVALMVFRASMFAGPAGWIEAVFQVVFLAGIVALLYGKPPSRERLVAGVIAVVLAWFGAAGGELVEGFFYTPPDIPDVAAMGNRPDFSVGQQIDDDRDGYKLDLPYGWVLIQDNVARAAAPGATLALSNSTAGCFVALQVEVLPSEEVSLDQYLTRLIESQKNRTPAIREVSRSGATIGSQQARRVETSWVEVGTPTRGFNTVCRRGTSYYVLSGRCEESTYASAVAAFNVLETRLQVRGVNPDAERYARKVRSAPPPATQGR